MRRRFEGRGAALTLGLAVCLMSQTSNAVALTTTPHITVLQDLVTITWKTDVVSTTELHWGPNSVSSTAEATSHSVASGRGTSHSRTLVLSPGTYFVRAQSTDGALRAASDELQFTVAPATSNQPLGRLVFDGSLNALALVPGQRVYVGGDFKSVAPRRGHGVRLDGLNGTVDPDLPEVNRSVHEVVPDGAGGFFIAGDFTFVGALRRLHVAHVLADGGVDPDWAPEVDGPLFALALSGDSLFLGGLFTSVSGTARRNAAALDRVSGAVLPWNPDVDGSVRALAVAQKVYLGGTFTTVGGVPRQYLAATSLTSGAVDSWHPAVFGNLTGAGYVQALTTSANRLYAGGDLLTPGCGGNCTGLVAFELATGALANWNSDLGYGVLWPVVSAVKVLGSTVYAVGSFTTSHSTQRQGAVALDATSAAVLPWDPAPGIGTYSLDVAAGSALIGGAFSSIRGRPRNNLVEVDLSAGNPTAWNPNVNGPVWGVARGDQTVFAGGLFTAAGSATPRASLAAIELPSGTLSAWSPSVQGIVQSLALHGENVLVAGSFAQVNQVARANAAEVTGDTGALTGWNPAPDNLVYSVALGQKVAYLGGGFSNAGGSPRKSLAAVDLDGGASVAWAPTLSGGLVTSLVLVDDALYVGGSFTSVNGVARRRAAALSATDAGLLPWDLSLQGTVVKGLAFTDAGVYVAGQFDSLNDDAGRVNVALVDPVSGLALPWDPRATQDRNGDVSALAIAGTDVFLAGNFTAVGTSPRLNVSLVDGVTGAPTDWAPDPEGSVNALAVDCVDGEVLVAGQFTSIASTAQSSLARFPLSSGCSPTQDDSRALRFVLSCGCSSGAPQALLVLSLVVIWRGRRGRGGGSPYDRPPPR